MTRTQTLRKIIGEGQAENHRLQLIHDSRAGLHQFVNRCDLGVVIVHGP